MSSSRLRFGRSTWTQSTARSASTRSGGRRVARGPISRSTARCSATKATPTCRATHRGGRAWIWDAIGALDPHVKHPVTEGASDPQARLADMDAMGVDQTLLYPTWFAEGFFLMRDPDVAHALARAYNDWVADFCKAAPERLFAAAILPLQKYGFRPRGIAAGEAHPVSPCRLYPADVHRRPLSQPSLLRPALGRTGTAHSGSARDTGVVEPGMDLARSVF